MNRFGKILAGMAVVTTMILAACSSGSDAAKINPVTGGSGGAIKKRPAREDLAVMVNGKAWDGQSDVDSKLYRVVGE